MTEPENQAEALERIAMTGLGWTDLPNMVAAAKTSQADPRTNQRWTDAINVARAALASLQSSPPVKAAAVGGEKLAEILANVDQWQKWAFEWSGSAFVSGEDLPEGDEVMSEAEHKAELYSGLCKLGNHMAWLHDEIAALASQHAVEGEAVAWGCFRDGKMVAWVPGTEDPEGREFRLPEDTDARLPLFLRPAAADAGVRVTLSRMGWDEQVEGGKLFTATAVFSEPPPWSADVVWKSVPFTLSLAAKMEQA